jgi:halogenation protein CepH
LEIRSRGDSAFDLDVIVVGGGPGGTTAATLVAQQGSRVLLLEREKGPAYKIGESLLPATIHGVCPLLGVSKELEEANFVVKRGGTFLWGKSPKPWTFSFASSSAIAGPTSTAYQVERMKFDAILLKNAREKGVDVREGYKATGLTVEDGRVVGVRFEDDQGAPHSLRARYVVDASGHQTGLSRFAGERVYSKFFQNVALFGYYRNGRRLSPPNQGNIFCAAFQHGWFWYIPLGPNLTSVGAVVGRDYAAKLSQGHEAAMKEFIDACPAIQDLLRNSERIADGPYGELRVRKDYSYSHSHFWAPGLVLVGDAACFIDPVFSSGVHLATYSGLLAARSLNTCLIDNAEEARSFKEFEDRYRREYSHFYDFLLAFYDMHQDLDSYYWHARKVTNSPELGNEAFINLVAGVAGSGERLYSGAEEYLKEREGLADVLFPDVSGELSSNGNLVKTRKDFYKHFLGEITKVQLQAVLKEKRPKETPLFAGGLIPSPDGLHWVDA